MPSTSSPLPQHGIIVGFDPSQGTPRAADWAADEATRRACPLLIVHAHVPQLPAMAYVWGPIPAYDDGTVRNSLAACTAELATDYRTTMPNLEVSGIVRDGHPAEVLREAADEANAELLVLAASELGPVGRMILGSTAADLVHDARRPVVVIRGDTDAATDPRPVLVGVDGTPASAGAIAFAFGHAARHRVRLHAVHARVHGQPDLFEQPPYRESAPDEATPGAGDTFLGTWKRLFPDVAVSTETVDEPPARALLDRAEHAQLLVVGTHGHGPTRRVLLGSVSHAALYHAPCPVAVVPGGAHAD